MAATSSTPVVKPVGPFKLVTVNTAPERAKRLIGRVVENLKERYTIFHVANVEEVKDVRPVVEKFQPDMLFCASMWTSDQSCEIQAIARGAAPSIKTMALPPGLQVNRGPDAVVEYLTEKVPELIHSESSTGFEKAVWGFRQHLPDLSSPRFRIAKEQTPYEYTENFQMNHDPPWMYTLSKAWEQLLEEPYKGITADGKIIPNLFHSRDEGVPIDHIEASVQKLLDQLSPEQRTKVSYPLNGREWRAWSNPELLLRPFGLRLEEVSDRIATSILSVLEATLSPEGYQKALGTMRINQYLGELCHLPRIMNKHSYNFLLFGEPSTVKPWGWSFYGHHLCLNVFLQGPQIVISPSFTGAEPNVIDSGEFSGTRILNTEEDLGLKLMQSFPPDRQAEAQTYKLMKDPRMSQTGDLITDRWGQDDQRHLCGAFRDNRIVPYEGILVSDFTPAQQTMVLDIVEQFVLYLPAQARQLRLTQVRRHFGSTYFSWIGPWGDHDAFYYRIQSPVLVAEFDHHSGVFLTNAEPAKYHTHTVLRTPNAGDYGCALRLPEDRVL